MIEGVENKMQKKDEIKETIILKDFFFPDYGITIKAETKEEAEKELQKQLALKNNNLTK